MKKSGTKKKNQDTAHTNFVVSDPYGFTAIEVTREQDNNEELTLHDEPLSDDVIAEDSAEEVAPEADLAQLERLNEAMVEEAAKAQAEAEELAKVLADTDPDTLLASQIAEDQALAAEIAREQAEQAEREARGEKNLDPEVLAALPNAQDLDISEIQSCLESLLFISEKPVSSQKLLEWLGPDFAEKKDVVVEALEGLQARYNSAHHGIELLEIAGGYQFRTKPIRAALSRQLAKVQTQRLSSGAMETLAIVAYKQPIMKEEIDRIRGVDSSYFIRGLLDRKLLKISGRSELPGRPSVFATTHEFLELFGLKDLDSMPPLHEIEAMVPSLQNVTHEEDPRVKEMRKLVGQMKSDTSTTLKYDPKEDERILQEIRERVGAIPTSTPTLQEQDLAKSDDAKRFKNAKKFGVFGDLGKAAAVAETPEAPEVFASPETDATSGSEEVSEVHSAVIDSEKSDDATEAEQER